MEDTNENWLETAVRYLKAKKIIRTVKDIAKATGYSEGALSNMINSKVEIGEKFRQKFFSVYPETQNINLKLVEEELGVTLYTAKDKDALTDKYIKVLEEKVKLQDDIIELLEDKVAFLENQLNNSR